VPRSVASTSPIASAVSAHRRKLRLLLWNFARKKSSRVRRMPPEGAAESGNSLPAKLQAQRAATIQRPTIARGGGGACCGDVGYGDDAGYLPRTPPARPARSKLPPIKVPSTFAYLFLLGVNVAFFSLILPSAAPTALHGEREGKHLGLGMVSQIYRSLSAGTRPDVALAVCLSRFLYRRLPALTCPNPPRFYIGVPTSASPADWVVWPYPVELLCAGDNTPYLNNCRSTKGKIPP
jgi:hypothetical protein